MLRDNPLDDSPFDLGEVSFHSGWLFHRVGANTSSRPREVMTIIYMDEDMRLLETHRSDWNSWCHGARVGEVIDTPTNPVLYSQCGGCNHRRGSRLTCRSILRPADRPRRLFRAPR